MRVAFALPLVPRGEGMAERRPRFPFRELRWLHGRRRTIPPTGPAPALLGTLNTRMSRRAPEARRLGAIPFLNGGLFSRAPIERRNARARFSDEAIGQVFGDLLGAFRFTARENQEHWGEASIDPEMLGRAFASLMAARERRTSGAFFTPPEVVARVTT